MNYSYEEEVRSNAGLADGIIGIDDPIIGFHILKNTCDLYVQSAGLSLSINRKHNNYLAFGLGILFVYFESLVPKPPASITTFISRRVK